MNRPSQPFDLDAYLHRIGHFGSREPTLDTLRAICAAQPARIAFENIDPLLGRPPSLSLEALQAKLIAQRRGGYCYELNLLLREALLALGMQVAALAARVLWMQPRDAAPRPRSHMLLKVELPDEARGSFIVDAGFGGHLLSAPLDLQPGVVQLTAAGRERIVRAADEYIVETGMPAGWQALYRFTLDAHLPVDFEPLNWFTATRPASLFANNLLLERLTPQWRAKLLNDRLTWQAHGEPPQARRIQSADDFAQVLEQVFELEPPVPAPRLFDRLPKGLDSAFIPGAG